MMDFGNVVTAMVTPFDAQGNLDEQAVRNMAAHLVRTGTDTILVVGTTGESPTLSTEEKLELVRLVKDTVSVPVMIGTGCNDTAKSIALSQQAEQAGADALLLVVPYYNKPNAEGLFRHFKAIAESTSLPCMLYNIPGRTGINMDADTIVRLSEISNIVALKAASGNLDQITRVRLGTAPEFSVYSGDDSMTLPILSLGGRGVVSVASNIIGTSVQDMVAAFHGGDAAGATERFLHLYPLFKGLFIDTNPIPVKYAASRLGLMEAHYRLPMIEPQPETRRAIERLLDEYDLS